MRQGVPHKREHVGSLSPPRRRKVSCQHFIQFKILIMFLFLRPFSCKICGQSYYRKAALRAHMTNCGDTGSMVRTQVSEIEPSSSIQLPLFALPTDELQELHDRLMDDTMAPEAVRRRLMELQSDNSSVVTKLAINLILKRMIIKLVSSLG